MNTLPITKEQVESYLQNCEEWEYGNKDTCHYIADSLINDLENNYNMDARPYRSDFISLAHSMNSGRDFYEIEIK